jgi:hypothetical protein
MSRLRRFFESTDSPQSPDPQSRSASSPIRGPGKSYSDVIIRIATG